MVNDVKELEISEKLRKPGTTVAKGRDYDADVTYLLGIIEGLRKMVQNQVVPSQHQLKELAELQEFRRKIVEIVGFWGPTA